MKKIRASVWSEAFFMGINRGLSCGLRQKSIYRKKCFRPQMRLRFFFHLGYKPFFSIEKIWASSCGLRHLFLQKNVEPHLWPEAFFQLKKNGAFVMVSGILEKNWSLSCGLKHFFPQKKIEASVAYFFSKPDARFFYRIYCLMPLWKMFISGKR